MLNVTELCGFGAGGEVDLYWSSVVTALHMDGADEGTTFTDSTGRHTYTASGAANTESSQAKFGTSLECNGTTSYIEAPYDADFDFSIGDFTIEAWIYTNTTTGLHDILSTWNNGLQGIRLELNGTGLYWYINNAAYLSTAITTSTWYHVAFVKSGSTIYKFVNGVGTSTTAPAIVNANRACRIGCGQEGAGTYFWNGYIDDLRITKGVARYTTNFTPPTQPFPEG